MSNFAKQFLALTLLLVAGFSPASTLAAELLSSVDKTQLSVNETITLSVRYDGQVISDPDFSALKKDFDVLSQQQSNQLSINNGNRVSFTTWLIHLLPKRSGKLLIPSFNLKGAVSDAIELTVSDAPSNQSSNENPVFIETSMDKTSAYVQEQIILTHRLYTRVNLTGVASDELAVENAHSIKIAESQYQKVINGLNHLVIETKYALFPQANGKLIIPQLRYTVTVPDSRRDPFASSFFSRGGKKVFLRTDDKIIEVKPRPANIAMEEWLPSTGISLSEKWSRGLDEIRVGEPITRTIDIVAQGLNSMQLPPLDIPAAKGFKIYPDQPQLSDEQNTSGVIGKRTESIAIVPIEAGEIKIPAISLSWWDTNTKQQRSTTLAAQVLKVLPAQAIEAMPVSTPNPPINYVETDAAPQNRRLLIALIISNVILFVLVVALLWQNRHLKKHPKSVDSVQTNTQLQEKQLFKNLRLAANAHNYNDFQQALLIWARHFWGDERISSLKQVSEKAQSEALSDLFNELDQKAYRPDASAQELDFIPAFKLIIEIRKQYKSSPDDNRNHLKPLYE